MNNLVQVEHPSPTIGELCQEIRSPSAPIKRSTHVGNQPPHELLLMTEFPPGIDIIMVDTIQGNDNYSSPREITLDREKLSLCTNKEAGGKIVGSISISKADIPEDLILGCTPKIGESLSDFHLRAIELLKPNNSPQIMSGYFGKFPDILRATISQIQLLGERMTRADNTGTIMVCKDEGPDQVGIFGVDDESPTSEGMLPPLNSMMAIDMLMSMAALNADKTIHLAGPDMIRYTRDDSRMEYVSRILEKTAAELGLQAVKHTYSVIDITGLKRVVPSVTHASQHQLLRAQEVVQVDLDKHTDQLCGSL